MTQGLVEENRRLNHESVLKRMYLGECTRLEKDNEELKELLSRTRDERYNQLTGEKEAAERCASEYELTVEQLQREVGDLRQFRGMFAFWFFFHFECVFEPLTIDMYDSLTLNRKPAKGLKTTTHNLPQFRRHESMHETTVPKARTQRTLTPLRTVYARRIPLLDTGKDRVSPFIKEKTCVFGISVSRFCSVRFLVSFVLVLTACALSLSYFTADSPLIKGSIVTYSTQAHPALSQLDAETSARTPTA
jgi:hypothetical protein